MIPIMIPALLNSEKDGESGKIKSNEEYFNRRNLVGLDQKKVYIKINLKVDLRSRRPDQARRWGQINRNGKDISKLLNRQQISLTLVALNL